MRITPANTGNENLNRLYDDATASAQQMFGPAMIEVMKKPIHFVQFHDVQLSVVDGAVLNTPSWVVKQIVWELAELNWRYELLALDRFAAPAHWDEDGTALARVEQVAQVFLPSCQYVMWNVPFPEETPIVTALTRAQRLPAMNALRQVMTSWWSCPNFIKMSTICDDSTGAQDDAEQLERQTMDFYCNMFFIFFHRPPILPLSLPAREVHS